MPEPITVIVDYSLSPAGWSVRATSGSPLLSLHRIKYDAINDAQGRLRESAEGGLLHIYNRDGTLSQTREIPAKTSAAPPRPEEIPRVADQSAAEVFDAQATDGSGAVGAATALYRDVKTTGMQIDAGINLILPIISLLAVSGFSGLVSPAVLQAAENGWLGVAFATLTWSLGCLLLTVILTDEKVAGYQAAVIAALCFIPSFAVAVVVGGGLLDLSTAYVGNPAYWLAGIAGIAIQTYGPVGALGGAIIGVWMGYVVARHIPDHKLYKQQ